MAWSYYLNLEPIALRSAWDAVSRMSDSNELNDLPGFPDLDAFYSNLQYGYIALVMGVSFAESSINTILRHIYSCEPDSDIMLDKIENKIKYLMRNNPDGLSEIKGSHCWQCFNNAKKVRNGLVHYKVNMADRMSSAAPLDAWKIGKQIAGDFFTRSSIEDCLDGIIDLIRAIVSSLDLKIAEGVPPIIPDASGAPVDFIYREDELPDDWDQLKDQIVSDCDWQLKPTSRPNARCCHESNNTENDADRP